MDLKQFQKLKEEAQELQQKLDRLKGSEQTIKKEMLKKAECKKEEEVEDLLNDLNKKDNKLAREIKKAEEEFQTAIEEQESQND